MIGHTESAIGEICDVCGHTKSIYILFSGPKKRYYCKCNHPSNKNIFTKILWWLKGSPAMEIPREDWEKHESKN